MKLAELARLNGCVARLTHLRNIRNLTEEQRGEVVGISKMLDPELWEEIWVKPVLRGDVA